MTVASLLISCVAAVAAIGAVWYGRGQKRAAETASQEARRAADAAADMATIERDRRAEELAEAERNRVVFRLEYEVGSAYRLRNRGTDTAYGVHVDLGGMGIVGDEPVDLPESPPTTRTSTCSGPTAWGRRVRSSSKSHGTTSRTCPTRPRL